MKPKIVGLNNCEVVEHPKHRKFFVRTMITSADNPSMSFHRGTVEVGGAILPHTHEKETETYYILSGKSEGTMGNDKGTYTFGSLFMAPPGVLHGLENIGDEPVEIVSVFTPPIK
ncbi:MAG: cupin domain-containing protein [Nitrospirota bacterium]